MERAVLTIAALFDGWPEAQDARAVRLLGAGALAARMAAAREELGRERTSSSCCANAPNSALATGSAPVARVERLR